MCVCVHVCACVQKCFFFQLVATVCLIRRSDGHEFECSVASIFLHDFFHPLQKPRAADFITKVEVGMVCCALFSSYRKWYRVVIKETTPSKKVRVHVGRGVASED